VEALVSRLTAVDVDRADVRKLAEMLRRECEHPTPACDEYPDCQDKCWQFAAALLGIVNDAVKWYNSAMTCESILQAEDGIRAAAREYLAAGGELSEEG
jgi:hypothetical protein